MKREILISATPRETRVAILEDDLLVELMVDHPDAERLVGDLMNHHPPTITPETDIFAITQAFVQNDVRRLPVLADRRVIGQVSRRDVLRAICRP